MGKDEERLADEGLSKEKITLFQKELEEKLNKFDSFFQIPDETLDKVTKLYDMLCKIDRLHYELEQFSKLIDVYDRFQKNHEGRDLPALIKDLSCLQAIIDNVKESDIWNHK